MSATMPRLYTFRHSQRRDDFGPCYQEGNCIRCGRPLVDKVALELDQRISEYHDFGGVPQEQSQGWFDFGRACANALRKRARIALMRSGIDRAAIARATGQA